MPHVGHSGWLVCTKFSIESFDNEDHILLAAVLDDGYSALPGRLQKTF